MVWARTNLRNSENAILFFVLLQGGTKIKVSIFAAVLFEI